jgi:cytochrome b pre-mRNA-processing protein 3
MPWCANSFIDFLQQTRRAIASRADRLNMRAGGARQGRPPFPYCLSKAAMRLLDLFRTPPDPLAPLYDAVVARARQPHWYVEGAVPDTTDGRFDMLAAVLSMVLLRMEDTPEGAMPAVRLAERFVDDMDGQLRQSGIGDVVVGKHIGRMMAMLGGRLGAYREGLAGGALAPALLRNLYRGEDPGAGPLAHVTTALESLHRELDAAAIDTLLAGRLPQ